MDQQPTSRKREVVATLAVLLVIVVIVGTVTATSKKDVASTSSATSTFAATSDQAAATTQSATADTNTASAGYKDGQYMATGGYQSPGGSEEITIKVTLKNGVITDTSAQNGATDSEAEEYQNKFIKNYKTVVVGKSIANISLSRVSGSSLTPIGFNNAISQIKSQAKA